MPGCSAKQSQNCSKTCVFYTINSCNSGFHFCNNVRCNIIRLNTVYLIVMYLKTRIMTSKSRRKKTLRSFRMQTWIIHAGILHDMMSYILTPRSAVFLLSVCPFSKPSTVRVGMLLFISQAMKADQACIVIFREKTAFRRYMICLFHVLDRLGSLSDVTTHNKNLGLEDFLWVYPCTLKKNYRKIIIKYMAHI